MAKDQTVEKAVTKPVDKTPDQALRDDWPAKHTQLAPFITINGRMRGGLKPSDQEKAKEILRSYGF
jgi:hypothetical protein